MAVIVNTNYGKMEGVERKGYTEFLSVPYAKPPVGELRFRKTQEPEPWDGVKKFDKFGPWCYQPGKAIVPLNKETGPSEDCLTLNIWTPACDNQKRPVAVWIHGGGYLTGCASTKFKLGDKMSVNGNMVVVSIQYRLGVFGFMDFTQLSGANERFDSNCGTWDQVAAIEWVHNNIEAFGGDPDNIAIMGESAGAASVMTLMTLPRLKGIIKRAVMESPPPFITFTPENAKVAALTFLEKIGLSEGEVYKLSDMPVNKLLACSQEACDDFVNIRPYMIINAPVVDGDLIPELPFEAIMNGAADGIPTLIGTSRDEATMFVKAKETGIAPASEKVIGQFFQENPEIDREKIISLYQSYPDLKSFREMTTEILFRTGSIAIADKLTETNPVYMYRYDYASPMMKLLKLGAVHCGESLFISGHDTGFITWFDRKRGKRVADDIHRTWCNFLTTGNPNGSGPEKWPKYGKEKKTYIISHKPHVEEKPGEREYEAYKSIRFLY